MKLPTCRAINAATFSLATLFLVGCASQPKVSADRLETPMSASVNDDADVRAVINAYIDGTSVENPEQLRQAFHPDFNLYARNGDGSLRVWDGQDYIGNFTLGETNARQGEIVFIDVDGNTAVGKVEILVPGQARFIDYLLLVRIEDEWKIIHKSYERYPIK